eukprot:COSAG02_NODE_185_length_30442_cov_59.370168_23_plen_170_part_00
MCLLNCEGAALVAGGNLHNYTAGSLVAFEDRVDHESTSPTAPRITPLCALHDLHAHKVVAQKSLRVSYQFCLSFPVFSMAVHYALAVINTDPENDRISLTVGVLHPDVTPEEFPSPHNILGYVTSGSNATKSAPLPRETLNPLMILASYYGYSLMVKDLLDQGAQPNAE